jgi:hypothetical protein
MRGGAGRGSVQHLENAPRGGCSCQAGMEAGAEQAQRQIKIRREDQDEESLLKGEPPLQQPQADFYRHHGDAEGRHQLHNQGRQKRHAQNAQRGLAKAVADLGNRPDLIPAAAQ